MTTKARKAIEEASIVVGYGTYIKLIQDIVRKDAEIISGTMGKEVERAKIAVKKANENHTVVMVSSGDPGVYGMAGIILEVADQEKTQVPIEIIPGITAASSASAILGAPLISDFAVISLSDLLTPLEKIEKRLELVSQTDMSIVLYNPQSQGRIEPLIKAYEIMIKYINPDTPIGIVRQVGREGQQSKITSLKNLLNEEIDMVTTIVIGNSSTKIINNKMVTKRGYSLTD
ncbi:MAG: precorrin-3B C(17)-methyltransferase [Candidatus Bathyarchaeota archaeon]|uniref:precorrin-3B C(17)-methyltransferase n=1 Tax=Candidatus Bathycorpusculum sp. TaxID=2994959 RepID=UPI00281825F3|nr:precorrin-3B C(17)-methyltransferase [Candidatus Termiticorpusculum sp.]MCL2257015.1 precorrin-3B C(17)-methyltransferase [Candidatus Termiticorpusculum sp.]MCL2292860.1 precorrin-3B C(17)-methyltransferase [Candidatus Termiticorpusculum sp.]